VFAQVDYRQQYLNCLAPMTLTMPHNAELPLGQIDLNLPDAGVPLPGWALQPIKPISAIPSCTAAGTCAVLPMVRHPHVAIAGT
jgi:hypothetical protein